MVSKLQANQLWCATNFEELIEKALKYIKQKKLVKINDNIIIVSGFPLGKSGNVNWIKIHQIT